MKKFLSFLVLVLVIAGGAPYVGGYYFKQTYFKLINNINAQAQGAGITVMSYQMGWRTSYAKLKIIAKPGVGDSRLGNLDFNEIIVDQVIEHGPVVFDNGNVKLAAASIKSNLHLPAPIEQVLLGNQNNKGVMQVTSVVGFDGKWADLIKTPEFIVNQPGLGELNFQGIDGVVNAQIVNHDLKNISGEIKVGQLDINAKNADKTYQVNVKPMQLTIDSNLDRVGLWNSKDKITIPAVVATEDKQPIFTIDNLLSSNVMKVSNGRFYNLSHQFSLDKLQVKGSPIPEVGPITYSVKISNLNVPGVIQFSKFAEQLQNSNGDINQAAQKQAFQYAMQMLDVTSQFVIDVNGNTPKGAFSLDFLAKLKDGTSVPKTQNELMANGQVVVNAKVAVSLAERLVEIYLQNNPGAMMQQAMSSQTMPSSETPQVTQNGQESGAMQQTENGNLPATNQEQAIMEHSGAQGAADYSEKAKQMLQSWVSQGYLKQSGQDYEIEMKFESGTATVNGQPVK